MFFEMLLHCMCDNVSELNEIEQIDTNYQAKALELNLHGRLVHYQGEVLTYFTGQNELDLLKFYEYQKSDDNFGYISKLFSGQIDKSCVDSWQLFHEFNPNTAFTEERCSEEKQKLQSICGNFSVGLELFFSVSEIMLSDKLYKFKG